MSQLEQVLHITEMILPLVVHRQTKLTSRTQTGDEEQSNSTLPCLGVAGPVLGPVEVHGMELVWTLPVRATSTVQEGMCGGVWETGRAEERLISIGGGIVPIRRGVSVCLCGMAHWHNDDVDYEYSVLVQYVVCTLSKSGWTEGRAQVARCPHSERHTDSRHGNAHSS